MLENLDPAQFEANHDGGPLFASALRAAVRESGLGLERIQRRIRARGANVSVATLSYWQSGRSMPGRRDSFEVVTHLEAVLGLSAGALLRLVPQRNAGRPRDVETVGTFAAAIGSSVEIPAIFAELDARLRRSIEMVSEHMTMEIGADRCQHAAWNRRIVRAVASGIDRVILAHYVADEKSGPPVVTPLTHCSVGERQVLVEPAVVLTELIFDRVLEKGESMMVEYATAYGPPYPADSYHNLPGQLPMREFVIEVKFDPAARPARCEWYEFSASNPDLIRRATELEVNATNSVLVVRHDLPPGRHGLRWFWD